MLFGPSRKGRRRQKKGEKGRFWPISRTGGQTPLKPPLVTPPFAALHDLVKNGFRASARNKKKNGSRDWSRNWPCGENREKKKLKTRQILNFPHFFPHFSAGPISGPISGAIFFLFRAGGPKPIFYQVGRFSSLVLQIADLGCTPTRVLSAPKLSLN